jgi:hypothetical protein
MANVKITGLTQATNAELEGSSLAYVVTDPSGTPASKKSTLERLGLPPVSFIEEQSAVYALGAIQTQDITLGCAFLPVRSGQKCSGVRIYWNSTGIATLKLALYAGNGGLEASVNITTTGTAGYYSGTFVSQVSLSRNVCYIASCYNTAGVALQLGETQRVAPTGSSIFPLLQGQRFRDYVLAADGKYVGGDGNPQGGTNTNVLYPVEPLIDG